MSNVLGGTAVGADEFVEAARSREKILMEHSLMPLSHAEGRVAAVLEKLGEHFFCQRNSVRLSGEDVSVLHSISEGIPAGEELGTGWGADGLAVVGVEDDAVFCQVVDVRSKGFKTEKMKKRKKIRVFL